MTYDATVEFKFDSSEAPSHFNVDVAYIPEQHFTLSAPVSDLNTMQMFKLFERFLLVMGYCPQSIMSGSLSLVFNDMVTEEQQRKVCNEYHLTMNEDLDKKFKEMKKLEEAIEQANSNLGTGK